MNTTFSPALDLQTAYTTLYISSIAVQLQAQTLIQQPLLSLDAVPTLSTDVLAVQTAARIALSGTETDVLRTVASGLGYCNLQVSMYDQLHSYAKAVDQGGSAGAAARVELVSGLNLLAGQIRMLQPGLTKLEKSANQLKVEVQACAAALAADAAIASTDPQVIALQTQIQAVLAALSADCETIANSMKGTVVGEIKLGIAMYNMEDKPVAAAKAFVGFILDTVKKDEAVEAALLDEQVQLKQLGALYYQLEQLEAAVAVVQTLASTASFFSAATISQANAASQLAAAWQLMLNDLVGIAEKLAAHDTLPQILAPRLAAQRAVWEGLSAELRNWQLQGNAQFKLVSYAA